MTKATEAAKEQERRKKDEEAKEAAAREEIAEDVDALMEIGSVRMRMKRPRIT